MLFLTDLLRVYIHFAHGRGWGANVSQHGTGDRGIRDAIVEVKGIASKIWEGV